VSQNYSFMKAQLAGATGAADAWYSIVVDASGRLSIAGSNTPADNFATPTNAIPAQCFLQAYDGAAFDLVRSRGWVSTVGVQTASAAAIDTVTQLTGPNGAGTITVARVNTTGALTVASLAGDIDGSANATSFNYGSTALLNTYSIALFGISSTLPGFTAGSNTKGAAQADTNGNLYVRDGAPALNARDNPTPNIAVDSADIPVKTSAGVLWSFHFVSTMAGGTVYYMQLHNKASALSGGDVPIATFAINGSGLVGPFDSTKFLGPHGRYFSAGIRIGFSSTPGTYTAIGAPLCVVSYNYY